MLSVSSSSNSVISSHPLWSYKMTLHIVCDGRGIPDRQRRKSHVRSKIADVLGRSLYCPTSPPPALFTADDYINFVQAKIESTPKSTEDSPLPVFSTTTAVLSLRLQASSTCCSKSTHTKLFLEVM